MRGDSLSGLYSSEKFCHGIDEGRIGTQRHAGSAVPPSATCLFPLFCPAVDGERSSSRVCSSGVSD